MKIFFSPVKGAIGAEMCNLFPLNKDDNNELWFEAFVLLKHFSILKKQKKTKKH